MSLYTICKTDNSIQQYQAYKNKNKKNWSFIINSLKFRKYSKLFKSDQCCLAVKWIMCIHTKSSVSTEKGCIMSFISNDLLRPPVVVTSVENYQIRIWVAGKSWHLTQLQRTLWPRQDLLQMVVYTIHTKTQNQTHINTHQFRYYQSDVRADCDVYLRGLFIIFNLNVVFVVLETWSLTYNSKTSFYHLDNSWLLIIYLIINMMFRWWLMTHYFCLWSHRHS